VIFFRSSDKGYFKRLLRRGQDAAYVARMRLAYDRAEEIQADAVKSGFDVSLQLFKDLNDPAKTFEGEFAQGLKAVGLKFIGPEQSKNVSHARVFLLPIRSLNGFANRTPRGTPYVVLNHDIILLLSTYTRWFNAYFTWYDPKPFCRDHSQHEFARAVICLARYAWSGDVNDLRGIRAFNCPTMSDWSEESYLFAYLIETAIVLHEFGHIVLGHVDSALAHPVQLASGYSIDALKLSRDQEFQADEFAFKKICDSGSLPRDTAYMMGLLFKFFELCERLHPPRRPEAERRHPYPEQRWQKIRDLAEIDKHPGSVTYHLDSAYEALIRFGLMPTSGTQTDSPEVTDAKRASERRREATVRD